MARDSFNNRMQEISGVKIGSLYSSSNGVLYHGDCLDFFPLIRDSSVDMVFADPPFNLNKNYGPTVKDVLKGEEYLQWCYKWLKESIRVLKPGGALFVYNIPRWATYLSSFLNDRMNFRHWIAICMKNTFPRGNTLYPAHYALLYYTKGKPEIFHKLRVPIPVCRHCKKEIKDYGGHRGKLNPKGLNLTDFWEDTSPVRHSKFKRRASNELKPMIPRRAIEISTNPGGIVLDPFGGGGSTYAMAEEMGRLWIGSEISTCAPILERLHDEHSVVFGKKPKQELISTFKKARD